MDMPVKAFELIGQNNSAHGISIRELHLKWVSLDL
jgi:hypothetical protein